MLRFRFPLVCASALMLAACPAPVPPATNRAQGVSVVPVSIRGEPERPHLRLLANGRYRVRKPWTVHIGGRTWRVQKGYSSNGITAPKRIRDSLGNGVDHPETWAAVFHDWLFTQPGVSRATADSLFYELLVAYGVSPQKARVMHAAVSAYSHSKAAR